MTGMNQNSIESDFARMVVPAIVSCTEANPLLLVAVVAILLLAVMMNDKRPL